ncbi:type II secretion system protein [Chromatiaceae bacterium AAb-1]|nr:type II secretion system protein [Chromatiaceae bacterium AAb-1]
MKARGFTLIELLLTMVILAILASGVSSYIGLGATMYTDAIERERILSQSRFVAERMVRELRNAVPNSVRVSDNGNCLEFAPVVAAGLYTSLDNTTLTYQWLSDASQVTVGNKVVVYPLKPEHVLDIDERNRSIVALSDPATPDTFTLNGAFETGSPARHFYIYNETVKYCKTGSAITRNGIEMARDVNVTKTQFITEQPTLKRNALINLHLQFGSGNHNDMFFNYEVHIPNVP